jgi:hypothetical protein
MSELTVRERRRREQMILDRLDNVRRLIEMETTLMIVDGAEYYKRYMQTTRDGKAIGDDLLHDLRDKIQLQLLSIVALCYGDNPDLGEPDTMLAWKDNKNFCTEDKFRETWSKCLEWNA